ncbi:MAG TPA: CopG family transcriptional regulator [Candidatus Competibacter sp.]|nr:CopG family transcriptional regulator [Candidatus Competibacter sp.]
MRQKTRIAYVNLRVTPEFKEMVTALAAAENRSITSLVEWLVLDHLKRNSKKDPEPPAG